MGITNNLASKLNLRIELKNKLPDFGIFWMGPDLLIHRTFNLQQADASQMIELRDDRWNKDWKSKLVKDLQ